MRRVTTLSDVGETYVQEEFNFPGGVGRLPRGLFAQVQVQDDLALLASESAEEGGDEELHRNHGCGVFANCRAQHDGLRRLIAFCSELTEEEEPLVID